VWVIGSPPIAIVDLVGQGCHIQTMPVPDWVKCASDSWLVSACVK